MLYFSNTSAIPCRRELAARTSRFVHWQLSGEVLAVAGEYLPDAIGPNLYLWLALARELTLAEVRQGLREAEAYLSTLDGYSIFAEVNPKLRANVRLLQLLNFEFRLDLGDRHLYQRRK